MPYNAFGKKVKAHRWIITRTDPLLPMPYSTYLCVNGFCGYHLERAARFKSEAEAEREVAYFRTTYPRYKWTVERE